MFNRLIPKISIKTRIIHKRNYQRHFQAAHNFRLRVIRLDKYIRNVDVLKVNNPEKIVTEFFSSTAKTFQHRRAGILLKKLDSGQEILSTDYDVNLIEFVNDHRRLGYADKSIYDKFDTFLETIRYE
jgi:hypothetical protein